MNNNNNNNLNFLLSVLIESAVFPIKWVNWFLHNASHVMEAQSPVERSNWNNRRAWIKRRRRRLRRARVLERWAGWRGNGSIGENDPFITARRRRRRRETHNADVFTGVGSIFSSRGIKEWIECENTGFAGTAGGWLAGLLARSLELLVCSVIGGSCPLSNSREEGASRGNVISRQQD